MTTFTEYRTTPGQRWDSIAYATYNAPYDYQGIIDANPQYRAVVEFSGVVTLRVPVVEEIVSTDPQLLPPWRR